MNWVWVLTWEPLEEIIMKNHHEWYFLLKDEENNECHFHCHSPTWTATNNLILQNWPWMSKCNILQVSEQNRSYRNNICKTKNHFEYSAKMSTQHKWVSVKVRNCETTNERRRKQLSLNFLKMTRLSSWVWKGIIILLIIKSLFIPMRETGIIISWLRVWFKRHKSGHQRTIRAWHE